MKGLFIPIEHTNPRGRSCICGLIGNFPVNGCKYNMKTMWFDQIQVYYVGMRVLSLCRE